MSEFLRLVSESPLSVALVICVALVAVIHRILPLVVNARLQRAAQADVDGAPVDRDHAFRARAEAHFQRVHAMAATFGEARRMVAQVDALEKRVQQLERDLGVLGRDLSEVKGLAHASDERAERMENKLDRISERLIGPQR